MDDELQRTVSSDNLLFQELNKESPLFEDRIHKLLSELNYEFITEPEELDDNDVTAGVVDLADWHYRLVVKLESARQLLLTASLAGEQFERCVKTDQLTTLLDTFEQSVLTALHNYQAFDQRQRVSEPLRVMADEIGIWIQTFERSLETPSWDSDKGELTFAGRVVRKVAPQATNLRPILSSFEEEGWPDRILDPLPAGPDPQRLRDAIGDLNRGLFEIRFAADGTGQRVEWKILDEVH